MKVGNIAWYRSPMQSGRSRASLASTQNTDELRAKVVEIVNKCPVHRTLKSSAVVVTSVDTRCETAPRAVPAPSGPDGKIP